jgi:integrase
MVACEIQIEERKRQKPGGGFCRISAFHHHYAVRDDEVNRNGGAQIEDAFLVPHRILFRHPRRGLHYAKRRVIRLEPGTTKNKDGRNVLMTDRVYQLLAGLVHGKKGDDFVFTRPNGKPVVDFRGMWNSACAYAGVPDLLFHDLRGTGARNLRRAGIAEGVIMKIGGWRTRSVFERYAIVDQADTDDGIL